MEFKIGDKVKILDTNGCSSNLSVGDVSKIVCKDDEDGYWLEDSKQRGITCDCGEHHWKFRGKHLELVKGASSIKDEPYKFKTINND